MSRNSLVSVGRVLQAVLRAINTLPKSIRIRHVRRIEMFLNSGCNMSGGDDTQRVEDDTA